ncbi:MAG: hypothetical protein K5629_01230 [Eubacteriales bacterium]|nr:hypothetical protein [Eubacteriales bacterium]
MNTISINYKNTPVSVRGQFSMTDEEEELFVSGLFSEFPEISQCVVLNTCNRFELYFDGTDENIIPVERELCAFKSADEKAVMENSFTYSGEDAITQLITLACGMDSMVLGEDEILRQIKEAYTKAHDKGRTGFEFNTIFKMAITAAKEIKTLTGLSMTPVSIGTLAAAEAARFKTEWGEVNVLIMGITGKIGLITAKNALAHGGIRLTGTTRAKDLKSLDVDGTQVPLYPFDERYSLFDGADVIISATNYQGYTVGRDEFLGSLSTKKNRLFIDLAVPADIDPALRDEEGCTLHDIDYFTTLAEENNELKKQKADQAAENARIWEQNIMKELSIREAIDLIPRFKKVIGQGDAGKFIYDLRKNTTFSQMQGVVEYIKQFIDVNEEKMNQKNSTAYFPLFVKAEDMKVLIVGGGSTATRKVRSLSDYRADVTVICENPSDEILAMQASGKISVIARDFEMSDIDNGYFLVVAATNDTPLNAAIAERCADMGILTDVVDDPQLCTALFPSIVKSGDVTAAISTNGKSPVIAKYLKGKVKEALPENISAVNERMNSFRIYLKNKVSDVTRRGVLNNRILAMILEDNADDDEIKQFIETAARE